MNHKYTKEIIKKASQSICHYRIAAYGFNKKGELIGKSINKPRLSKPQGGLHAEMSLMKHYGTKLHTIVICRIGNAGDLRPIKPCVACKAVADYLGIKIRSIAP
jgi:cytidine deaminase